MSADATSHVDPPRFSPREWAAWTQGTWERPPVELCGVCRDTRDVRPGSLFVAIRGARLDGHAFVAEALRRGAAAAMVAADWPADGPWPLLRVADTRRGLSEAAAGYRREVRPFTVGITGSAGKTTVKEWTAALLGTAGATAATIGNFNNDIGLPLSMLSMPRDTRHGVFEIGTNHPGEIAALAAVLAPDAGIVTNVGPVHLEFFGTIAAIAHEKAALLRSLPTSGFAVLDAASSHFDYLASQTLARVVTVALDAEADFTGTELDPRTGALTVRDRGAGTAHRVQAPAPGRHNALNALLAIAASRMRHVDWSAIAATLPSAPSAAMRWEVRERAGVRVVNDAYNANPIAVRAALETLAATCGAGRRVLVLGEMRELGQSSEEEHRGIGRSVAATGGDVLITVGTAGQWIADGAVEAGFRGSVLMAPDAAEAGKLLAEVASSGDTVLLKASRGVGLEHALDAWVAAARGRDEERPA